MADTKISGLTTLADADVADDDYIPVADTSTTTTKKIGVSALKRKTQSANAQTGTSYGLVLADADKLVTLSNASPITLTVPNNSTQAFPIYTRIDIMQLDGGQVEVAAAGGVTVQKNAAFVLFLRSQWAEATLTKISTNTWVLTGLLEEA
jgi:hypothetical protein